MDASSRDPEASADHTPLATFLVECYWPDVDLAILDHALPRLEAAARAMTAEGTPVEYLGPILMPLDHVAFSLIAAVDESLVRRLNERADLPVDRIVEATALLDPIIAPGRLPGRRYHK